MGNWLQLIPALFHLIADAIPEKQVRMFNKELNMYRRGKVTDLFSYVATRHPEWTTEQINQRVAAIKDMYYHSIKNTNKPL